MVNPQEEEDQLLSGPAEHANNSSTTLDMSSSEEDPPLPAVQNVRDQLDRAQKKFDLLFLLIWLVLFSFMITSDVTAAPHSHMDEFWTDLSIAFLTVTAAAAGITLALYEFFSGESINWQMFWQEFWQELRQKVKQEYRRAMLRHQAKARGGWIQEIPARE